MSITNLFQNVNAHYSKANAAYMIYVMLDKLIIHALYHIHRQLKLNHSYTYNSYMYNYKIP